MPTQRECACCHEIRGISHGLPDNPEFSCIAQSGGFRTLVMNIEALDIYLLLDSSERAESLIRPIGSRFVVLSINIIYVIKQAGVQFLQEIIEPDLFLFL